MITTCTKFITIDVLLVNIMNVLTIPLEEIYSWISLTHYIFSLISNYLGWNFINIIYKKIHNFFKKSKLKNETHETWNHLRGGCILEANILIFTRILMYFFSQRFFYITKVRQLFSDCSLKTADSGFELLLPNMILIICLHLGIVVVILIIMAKNKRILLELIVEDF